MKDSAPIRDAMFPEDFSFIIFLGTPQTAAEREASTPLTPRQTELMSLVAQDLTHKEIADRLKLSTDYVRQSMTGIYRKLGTNTQTSMVKKAAEMGIINTAELVGPDFDPAVFNTLTPREKEVAELLTDKGFTNKKIARELGINARTVQAHLQDIYTRTQLFTRVGLVTGMLEARRRAVEVRGDDQNGSGLEIQVFPQASVS